MIKCYGYRNGRAVAVNNHKNLMKAFWITLLPAAALSVPAVMFLPAALIAVWLLPVLFFCLSRLVFAFVKYDEKVFLEGQKKRHVLQIENGSLLIDGKCRRLNKISLYSYKRELLLILNGSSFYLIPDGDYLVGSREELLSCFTFRGRHTATLKTGQY